MSEATKAPAIDEVMARGFKSTITELTAALTAEIRDRVALTATVAALTAENERQSKAINEAIGWLTAMLETRKHEDDTELREMQDMLAAALPSTRETTDGQ